LEKEIGKEEKMDTDTDTNTSVTNDSEKFREKLLGIKNSLEKLQSDFGFPSSYLLIVEDNVTKKPTEKVEGFSTFGRILCCGDGEPRKFFCEGNLTFQPSVMSFLGRGDKLEEDKVFMEEWADAVKMRGQVKQEAGIQNNVNMSNQEMPQNNMAIMANMLAHLQAQAMAAVKQKSMEAGDNATNGNMDVNNIVKSEPIDPGDVDGGGDFDPSMFLAMAMNAQASNNFSGIKPFIDPDLANNSTMVKSDGAVNYSCSFCDFKTTSSKSLSVHVRELHKTGLKKFICKECKFTSMNKQLMQNHMMSEHKKALIRCKEDKCSFVTLSIEQFRAHAEEHKQNVPGVTLDFKCDFCPFRTSSRKGIGVHINRIHSTESPAMRMMQIKKNEKHEKKKQELQALIDKARKEKNVNCLQSESESKIQNDKIQPLIRNDQLEAKIEEKFEFKSVDSIMAKTPKPSSGNMFYCDQCEYKTNRSYSLETHKKARHDGVKFSCDQCDAKYSFPHALTKHKQNKHTM